MRTAPALVRAGPVAVRPAVFFVNAPRVLGGGVFLFWRKRYRIP